jgi:hypothetical protein
MCLGLDRNNRNCGDSLAAGMVVAIVNHLRSQNGSIVREELHVVLRLPIGRAASGSAALKNPPKADSSGRCVAVEGSA